jgi:hypothetical protein
LGHVHDKLNDVDSALIHNTAGVLTAQRFVLIFLFDDSLHLNTCYIFGISFRNVMKCLILKLMQAVAPDMLINSPSIQPVRRNNQQQQSARRELDPSITRVGLDTTAVCSFLSWAHRQTPRIGLQVRIFEYCNSFVGMFLFVIIYH